MKEIKIKYILALSVLFSLVLVGLVYAGGFLNDSSKEEASDNPYYTFGGYGELFISDNGSDGLIRGSNPEIEALSYEYLSENSDVILIGTVKEILPGKWNTVDGKRPHDSIDDFEWYDMIYTDIVITADEYLKNPLPEDEVIVRVFTGTVGNDVSTADYEASFQKGEKVFLYLIEDEWEYTRNLGPDHYFTLGSIQGKLTLTDDGNAMGVHGNISQNELVEMI
ncbi:hypothetical protein [Methanolobus vulcani]|uniref:hypothetical protein n=1 Tax=Methanolobus vulcani TaxID=38026 RepID=UPI001E32DEBC|nr:hypothetical protein [Methanolobus vulcani]